MLPRQGRGRRLVASHQNEDPCAVTVPGGTLRVRLLQSAVLHVLRSGLAAKSVGADHAREVLPWVQSEERGTTDTSTKQEVGTCALTLLWERTLLFGA